MQANVPALFVLSIRPDYPDAVASAGLRTTSLPGSTKTIVAIDPGEVASVDQEPDIDGSGRPQCCIGLQDGYQVYVQGDAEYVAGVIRAAADMDPSMLIRAAEDAWKGVPEDA